MPPFKFTNVMEIMIHVKSQNSKDCEEIGRIADHLSLLLLYTNAEWQNSTSVNEPVSYSGNLYLLG